MPTYEYRCEKCGEFEYSQRITDPALQRCPTCKRKVRRLISSTSFQLKGSGWYVTDYARAGGGKDKEKKGDTKDGGGEAGSSSSTSESSSGKSESSKSEGNKSEGSKSGDTTKPESKKTANA
jgi:putative FmdB family regulatory protein